jgi:hypothetical protein
MLRIMHIEEIEGLLRQLPELVNQQQQRSTGFLANVGSWLNSLEQVFTANRLYQAGNIAMLRSSLIAAEQGQLPAGLQFRARPSRSRIMNAVATQAVQRAAEVAATLIAENRPRLEEAERVARQIVAAALSRGLIAARPREVNNTHYLRMLRRSLATSSDLESAVAHLEGLVGPHDALVLIDRALTPHLEVSPMVAHAVGPSSHTTPVLVKDTLR